ncbi:MAG: hypothetical protein KIT83_22680, partial [Bryobacterales bacterium]|nr:hypothetical protein [Bryobacterales bacterium]
MRNELFGGCGGDVGKLGFSFRDLCFGLGRLPSLLLPGHEAGVSFFAAALGGLFLLLAVEVALLAALFAGHAGFVPLLPFVVAGVLETSFAGTFEFGDRSLVTALPPG